MSLALTDPPIITSEFMTASDDKLIVPHMCEVPVTLRTPPATTSSDAERTDVSTLPQTVSDDRRASHPTDRLSVILTDDLTESEPRRIESWSTVSVSIEDRALTPSTDTLDRIYMGASNDTQSPNNEGPPTDRDSPSETGPSTRHWAATFRCPATETADPRLAIESTDMLLPPNTFPETERVSSTPTYEPTVTVPATAESPNTST